MKPCLVALVLAPVLSIPVWAADPPAPGDDARTVDSKIAAVTVYPDRARVIRAASLSLPAGPGRFAFRKLPGWMDEGSVRVTVTPSAAAEILDVQVLKTFLARPDDDQIRAAETAVREAADELAELDDEAKVLDAKMRQVDAIRVFSLDKIPKDAAVREIKVEEYNKVVGFVADAMEEVSKAKRKLEKKRRDLQPELDVRRRKLNEIHQRSQLEQRTVLLTLKAPAAGTAEITLTYMLPGATWEPVHELRAASGVAAVSLASFGTVTQTTGEDWDGAALSLSTQRSSDAIRIPEVEALLVGGGRPLVRALQNNSSSFQIAAQNYDGQFMVWNAFANPQGQQREVGGNWMFQKEKQARNVETFRVLQQQRGTTAHFAALAPQTIRTDGRPVRVPIGASQLAAQPKILAAPEASLNAARIADLVNTGKQPFLPGRVLLFVEGAFLGTTDIEFVAQGESFPVFLGVADHVKLSRVLDRKMSSLSWTGKRTRMQVCYAIGVENLSDAETPVQLTDRVPVSESEDIRVTGIRIVPAVKPDTKGLLKWDLKLAPRQALEFRVEYALDYPTELPARKPPILDESRSPAAPDLHMQIKELEKALH